MHVTPIDHVEFTQPDILLVKFLRTKSVTKKQMNSRNIRSGQDLNQSRLVGKPIP